MTKKSVFLDTSFLIASQVRQHVFLKRSEELRKQFAYQNFNLVTTQIVFDEFWYVLFGIGKIASKTVDINDVYSQIIDSTKNAFLLEHLSLLNMDLNQKELMEVLEVMHKFKLRPRDAMIVKLMKKAKIKLIASFDNDFDKVSGISRIY